MILGATLKLRDNFTSTMNKANQATQQQIEAMKSTEKVTGAVTKSTTNLRAQLRAHKSELKENMARLDGNKNSMEALRIKTESYTKQLNVQKQIVSNLANDYKRLATAHGEESTIASQAAARLAKARAEQASLERQIKNTTNAIKNQSSSLGRLKQDFQKAKADAMPTDRFAATRQAGTVITGVGVAGAAGLGGMVKVAADFEAAMSRVGALSGATDSELQKLTETAIELGAATSFSAREAAEGMQYLSMAGFKTNDMIAAMPGMLDMAAAAQIDLGSAADIASNILSAFGLEAGKMGPVGDILTKAFTSSNTDLQMLGNTMKYVGPIAKAAGFSLEEMSAAAGLLGNAGIQGEQAGTNLRAIITRLVDPPKEAANAMAQLGLKITDSNGKLLPMAEILERTQQGMKDMTDAQKTAVASQLAGTEAASAFLALLDVGPASLKQFTQELENAGGTARRVADQQLNNLKGSLEELGGATESASIAIGNVLSPYIRQAADHIKSLVDKFNNLSPGMKKTIATVLIIGTGFALVAGPILVLIGMLPLLAAGFAIITGPIVLITLGIMALVAAGIALWMNWDTIKERAGKIWEDVKKTVSGFIDNVVTKFTEFKENVFRVWGDIKTFLKNPIKGTVDLVEKVVKGDDAKGHASGLPYVPYDNYLALLHKGEAVLTRVEADQYRKRQTSPKETIQRIRQQLIPVNIPSPGELAQTIKQYLIPAQITKPEDLLQTIRQHLVPAQIPTVRDTYQNIYQRLIQPDSWEMPALLNNYPTLLDRGENTLPRRDADHHKEARDGKKDISISKLADTIIVREEADIDKIAAALVRKIEKAEVAYGGVW